MTEDAEGPGTALTTLVGDPEVDTAVLAIRLPRDRHRAGQACGGTSLRPDAPDDEQLAQHRTVDLPPSLT